MNIKKLRINEIFYSLQGEGAHAGEAAVFVRFSGCNLKCPFCDTDFADHRELTEDEIVAEALRVAGECRFLVFTGGEPALQLTPYLVGLMHNEGFYVAVETNGTHPLPHNVDWITVSPKTAFVPREVANLAISRADEVKMVFDEHITESDIDFAYERIEADHYWLQPCDTGIASRNRLITEKCVNFVKDNPKWSLSMQIHKILKLR